MARCAKCNRSNHPQCRGGDCDCKCRGFTVKGDIQAELDRRSDPKQDEFFEDVNEQWKKLQKVKEKKIESKP